MLLLSLPMLLPLVWLYLALLDRALHKLLPLVRLYLAFAGMVVPSFRRTPLRGGTYKYLREDLRRGYLWILGEGLSATGLRSECKLHWRMRRCTLLVSRCTPSLRVRTTPPCSPNRRVS